MVGPLFLADVRRFVCWRDAHLAKRGGFCLDMAEVRYAGKNGALTSGVLRDCGAPGALVARDLGRWSLGWWNTR